MSARFYTYDNISNPLNDGTWTYTWEKGRQLRRMSKSDRTVEFKYNENGLRIQKTVNGVVTNYTLHGKNIVNMTQGSNTLHFFYDASNKPAIVEYNGTKYAYVHNLQGDIVAILDSNGNKVVEYKYDAWGRPISCSGTMASTLGKINPFRYRGYVYDEETGLYYLRNRYYAPTRCKFINEDEYTSTTQGMFSSNMYAYCENNPVLRTDYSGDFWHIVTGAVVGALVGCISSIVGQVVSGQDINWGEVGVAAASGALTGAITAACPGMGAVTTGIVHGAVGAGTYAATELVNGRIPTLEGTLAAGITAGLLAGGAKAISNRLTTKKLYRSVCPDEANSFSNTGKLSAGTGHMEGKFFATTQADAQTWGARLNNSEMISIRVPNSALQHSSVQYFERLDAIGPAYYFSDMDYLNSILR